jgi:hypothetical protein
MHALNGLDWMQYLGKKPRSSVVPLSSKTSICAAAQAARQILYTDPFYVPENGGFSSILLNLFPVFLMDGSLYLLFLNFT